MILRKKFILLIVSLSLVVLFNSGSWLLIKPAFKHIEDGVHQLNGVQYIQATENYLLFEDVYLDNGVKLLTLGQLKKSGYVGTRQDMGLNLEIFSPPQHPYSDDSRILIVKSNNQTQYYIRLCPYRVKVCSRDSETLLDTFPK
ncbi:hypothetical protein [Peribacillus acanthi]|uniref:hypothetical protein n=1 Tax=Peribacillus acanthi TaxID=2171554 RepID=UPI001300B40B|nr:hypothetical protein [Peribacillus acanthi]